MNMGAFGVIVWVQRNGGTDSLETSGASPPGRPAPPR